MKCTAIKKKKLQKILTGKNQFEETDLEISKNTKQNKYHKYYTYTYREDINIKGRAKILKNPRGKKLHI